ncbi:MAG: preprotein translocase subunit SecA, partial [Malacoplasma sp.]|nr:preprotein translocase subunit SecA [Malacoplasma sp.]
SKILVKAKLIAQQVENNFDEYQSLSIEDLKIRTDYLIDGLSKNKFTLDDIVVDAFSIAREIIYREYGMLAYQVQMMGAYIVHCGDFAEMYTGEGKSLTLLLVSFLNALTKRGVHIVTVNEYLVERDAKFAEKAFEKLGITVGYNTSKLSKEVKREMFAKDITYTTNSELGFDYLKDNMVRSIEEKVIRELFFVIVDEADSVLIDEARTPLIISGQPKEDFSLYVEIDAFVSELSKDDYKIDDESNTIFLTDSGVEKAEKFFQLDNLYSVENAEVVHKITNALVAHYIFANGKEYLVKDDKIYLVDQFTGRVLEGRSYNAGLQQAIQAKERVKIEPENVVMATITYQSFFRLYEKLSGVSGTAMTEAEEFLKIYNMVVVRIPTNKPVIRIDKPDYIFGTKKVKWNHVVAEIVSRHETGQPILVGTASVTDSEIIHQRLNELGIDHEVLNARDNTKEAEIIKHAGEKGAITISTNMAGRGTDIKVDDEVRALGGLYVIGTERHESRRIDNQLRGRTGRQGDPGESRFFTSLEDSLFKRFATDRFAKASEKLEDDYYDFGFFSKLLDTTQKKVEGLNFDIRKNLMDYDHVLSLQRELIYKQRDQILLKTSNFA